MVLEVRTTLDGQEWIDHRALEQRIFGGGEVPRADELTRRHFGRSLTPATIEAVLQQANNGYMRDLTDLESETIGIDGHLFSVVGKRFPIIASIDYDVVPVDGPGLDPEKAMKAAEVARHGLAGIPNLRQALVDLTWGHFHGRASVEKEWAYKPSSALKWSIAGLHWIHPRRLSFGPERELRLVDSMSYSGYFKAVGFDLRSIRHKWITFTPRLRNEYPEREGIGPICLYWAYFKRFSTRDRLILMEVFGKPWRIIEWDATARALSLDALDKAQETADKLGANASASMPIGAKLKVEQPGDGAGEVHADVIASSNDEISKIVLGQTRTTEAKPNAIGSSGDETAAGEQDAIIDADGWRLSDVMTEQLARDFVELNLGDEWSLYTPRIIIRTQRPVPRSVRIANAEKVLKLGVPVKLEQVYEETGYERPADGDATIQLVNAGDRDAWGNMTAVTKTVIRDPSKPLPPPPKPPPGVPPASDSGTPAAPTSEPTQEPDQVTASTSSTQEPSAAELLAAKLTSAGVDRCEHGSVNRCRLCGVERVRDFDVDADGKPVRNAEGGIAWKVAWKAIEPTLAAVDAGDDVIVARMMTSARFARLHHGDHVCMVRQPESKNGSPEALIDGGVKETARETARWGVQLVDATDGIETATGIAAALDRAAERLPLTTFARVAERRILHGLMLGALDSLWERETDEPVPLERFAAVRSEVILMAEQLSLPFAEQPFDRAVRMFRERSVLGRDMFEQLAGAAKRRAFTIAKLARQDLLDTAHAELARMIEAGKNAMVDGSGPSLREFKKFCAERLESAGWTPANPSHVEIIYRQNVVGAYNDGRHAEMTQPDVLAARPIWQVRGVGDSRQRPTHREANGLCYAANDPSWPRPPFGFACRCRQISRSQRWFSASGKALSAPPAGLPDEGFDAREGSLLDLASAE